MLSPPCFLQLDPTRSEVFRGLGGAYQSQGQHQMAFASYQQAINLAPWDLLAYLKLGMLYEDLVSDGARPGVGFALFLGRRVSEISFKSWKGLRLLCCAWLDKDREVF